MRVFTVLCILHALIFSLPIAFYISIKRVVTNNHLRGDAGLKIIGHASSSGNRKLKVYDYLTMGPSGVRLLILKSRKPPHNITIDINHEQDNTFVSLSKLFAIITLQAVLARLEYLLVDDPNEHDHPIDLNV
jgi:hypothetical protein